MNDGLRLGKMVFHGTMLMLWSLMPTVLPVAYSEPPPPEGIDRECRAALEKLCEGIQPGSGRLRKCYEDNQGKLTPSCRQQVQERKSEAAAIMGMTPRKEGEPISDDAQAQLADAIQLTNDAIVELTDPPGLGKRTTVDLNKRWGSDIGVIDSATAKLQEAGSKAQAGGADRQALHRLEMAKDYGKAREHKEARLSAQGALFHLCKGNNGQGPGCDTVPKYGSYTAP